jgi:hypothetical protein
MLAQHCSDDFGFLVPQQIVPIHSETTMIAHPFFREDREACCDAYHRFLKMDVIVHHAAWCCLEKAWRRPDDPPRCRDGDEFVRVIKYVGCDEEFEGVIARSETPPI